MRRGGLPSKRANGSGIAGGGTGHRVPPMPGEMRATAETLVKPGPGRERPAIMPAPKAAMRSPVVRSWKRIRGTGRAGQHTGRRMFPSAYRVEGGMCERLCGARLRGRVNPVHQRKASVGVPPLGGTGAWAEGGCGRLCGARLREPGKPGTPTEDLLVYRLAAPGHERKAGARSCAEKAPRAG